MTEGQHSHEELQAEIDALKAAVAETAQQDDAATEEATQAAAQAVQAAEAAVVEGAVTRADFEAFRDEMRAAIESLKTQPAPEPPAEPEPSGIPAAPAELPDPPAGEALAEGEPQEAPAPEPTGKKNPPSRKKKSVWWD